MQNPDHAHWATAYQVYLTDHPAAEDRRIAGVEADIAAWQKAADAYRATLDQNPDMPDRERLVRFSLYKKTNPPPAPPVRRDPIAFDRFVTSRIRRHVFQNVCNGVPRDQIRESLHVTDLEIDQAVAFVGKKITQHLIQRRQPPIECLTERDIRWNRLPLLMLLARIGDLDLSTGLVLRKMLVQALDHPEMIDGAQRRLAEASA